MFCDCDAAKGVADELVEIFVGLYLDHLEQTAQVDQFMPFFAHNQTLNKVADQRHSLGVRG